MASSMSDLSRRRPGDPERLRRQRLMVSPPLPSAAEVELSPAAERRWRRDEASLKLGARLGPCVYFYLKRKNANRIGVRFGSWLSSM